MSRITFLGAAQTVTGSKYLLEAGGARVMIDCGLFQGPKRLRVLNWEPLPPPGDSPHAVVLTHAHLDHCGYLPRLFKGGFRGKVYCTPATKELTRLILLDSARNQKRDADYANRKGFTRHKPALPLYDTKDARQALKRLRAIDHGGWVCVKRPIWVRFHDAGHLLGSSFLEIEIRDGENDRPRERWVFSGDLGRYDAPLYHDPKPPPPCDYLVCESTYGLRNHPGENLLDELQREITLARERGGVTLFASFAVGRSQQLIYLLRVLMHQGRLPKLPIYLDSPMAVEATEIFRGYWRDYDLAEGQTGNYGHVLEGEGLDLVTTVAESKKLNQIMRPAVIISSSGMMAGGRILYHLKRRLPDPRNTILMSGFSVPGTRGALLNAGAKTLRIHGQDVPVRAAVARVRGLSGHADQSEILRWLEPMPGPKNVFVTHGEKKSALGLADLLHHQRGWDTVAPELHETHEVS
jgi:metallo-beta-lactamase family protein